MFFSTPTYSPPPPLVSLIRGNCLNKSMEIICSLGAWIFCTVEMMLAGVVVCVVWCVFVCVWIPRKKKKKLYLGVGGLLISAGPQHNFNRGRLFFFFNVGRQ